MKVAFDVDGTLITDKERGLIVPRYEVIFLFKMLEKFGCEMYIWSGSGVDWAESWARKLDLNAKIVVKGSFKPDLTFDDNEVTLGDKNIKV